MTPTTMFRCSTLPSFSTLTRYDVVFGALAASFADSATSAAAAESSGGIAASEPSAGGGPGRVLAGRRALNAATGTSSASLACANTKDTCALICVISWRSVLATSNKTL